MGFAFLGPEDGQLTSDSCHLISLPLSECAGFDLDLNAVRLVSFSEDDDPVWMTERQKIIEKAKGRKFMDV